MRRSSIDFTKLNRMTASDDEWLPFKRSRFDGAISCINSQWIQNMKGHFYLSIMFVINFNRIRN